MGTYIKNTEDRKDISRRIVELTGEKLKYTMPASSFVGRGFTLTREGILEADETADKTVLETLIAEGLILALAETDTEAETGAEGQESAEDTHEAEETVTEPTGEGQETIAEPAGSEGLTISVPLNGHTGLSLRNLISMIYSRGRLISKATGGSFSCTEGLADYLKDDSFITTSEKLITGPGAETYTGKKS